MIQELLGGSKLSVASVLEGTPSSNPSPSPSPSPSSSTISTPTSSSTSENLRCPRCDSSNTKFCYYNNYNLTQPRHFCKTCRRYWTKGGALRNVPIGGGCRKNKNTSITTCVAKSSAAKLKTVPSTSDIGKANFIYGLEHELSSNPILWTSTPQHHTHPLSLLRANRNPNPNPPAISNSISVKEEGFLLRSQMSTGSPMAASGAFDAKTLGFCSSYWRNNQQQAQQNQGNPHHQLHHSGFALGETQNTGFQELYQRLRSSTNYYPDQATAVLLGNVASSSTILDSAPVAGGHEMGLWGNPVSWSDLPTSTSGALP